MTGWFATTKALAPSERALSLECRQMRYLLLIIMLLVTTQAKAGLFETSPSKADLAILVGGPVQQSWQWQVFYINGNYGVSLGSFVSELPDGKWDKAAAGWIYRYAVTDELKATHHKVAISFEMRKFDDGEPGWLLRRVVFDEADLTQTQVAAFGQQTSERAQANKAAARPPAPVRSPAQPQAENSAIAGVQTANGKLGIFPDMVFLGNTIIQRLENGNGARIEASIPEKLPTAVLIAEDTGGVGCPTNWFFIDVGKFTSTKLSSCSENVEVEQHGGGVVVISFPPFGSAPASKWRYAVGKISKF